MGSSRGFSPYVGIRALFFRRPRTPRSPAEPGRFLGPVLFCAALLGVLPAAAQTSLETELRNLEERVRLPGSAGRQEELRRLAGLRELAGDIEGAASSWELAALAAPGGRDIQALLRGAACFMTLGEWERADAALMEILLDSRAGEERFHAFFLKALLEGLRSGGANVSPLVSLLEDPSFGQWRSRICFSLWKLTGRESWRSILAAEFPWSPEGRIALSGGQTAAGLSVAADPSPMWLLFAAGRPPLNSPPAAGPRRAAAREEAPPVAASGVPGQALLQAGIYSREANARNLLEKLRAAGFSARMDRQVRAGREYIVVYVAPGPDINRTIRDLEAAGFDSFPVVP